VRKLWLCYSRLITVPFETLIGALVVYAGIAGLLRGSRDPLDLLLPHWEVLAFQVAYGLAGLQMLGGLAFARPNVEAAGLILLGMNVIVRFIAVVDILGITEPVVELLFLYGLILAACLVRVIALFRHQVIIRGIVDGTDGP
jgi:uncharacterized membrane protein YedE/YeeE